MLRLGHARVVPRPFVLRVYAAGTPEGWRAMPGGFCRMSDQAEARAVSMGKGVESADVWVLAKDPVEVASLLPPPETARIVRMLGNLPSRAADNLFWFGRYLEREEATLRLVRCLAARARSTPRRRSTGAPIDRAAEGAAVGLGRDPRRNRRRKPDVASETALRDEQSTARRWRSPGRRATPRR